VLFGVDSRWSFISVDGARLAAGLIVIGRVSEGAAADLPTDFKADLDPAMPARLVIEQVSAVEHAWVAGVPLVQSGDGGQAVMSAGLGRPLIHTTLDIGDAMRVLGEGRRMSIAVSVGLAVLGVALVLLAAFAALIPAPVAAS
jgi:hypothetical protein